MKYYVYPAGPSGLLFHSAHLASVPGDDAVELNALAGRLPVGVLPFDSDLVLGPIVAQHSALSPPFRW